MRNNAHGFDDYRALAGGAPTEEKLGFLSVPGSLLPESDVFGTLMLSPALY